LEVVKELLEYCSASTQDAEGNTAIIRAAENGHSLVVEYLHSRGASILDRNAHGDNVLTIGASTRNAQLVDWWLSSHSLLGSDALIEHVIPALQSAGHGASVPSESTLRILREYVVLGAAPEHQRMLFHHLESVRSSKDACLILVLLDKSHFWKFAQPIFLYCNLSKKDMKEIIDNVVSLPSTLDPGSHSHRRTILIQIILFYCSHLGLRELIINESDEFAFDVTRWLPAIYYTIVPRGIPWGLNRSSMDILLDLVQIMPDSMFNDPATTRSGLDDNRTHPERSAANLPSESSHCAGSL
jgi:hypothetical protein